MVYKLADDVQFIIEGSSTYLSKGDLRYDIAGSAIQMVELIDGERTLDDIVEELMKIYGSNVEAYTLVKDFELFMGDLVCEGLVTLVKSCFR
ncbi:MAG: PqqD family protein [Firmicutes bacterium]|nr:PqqD family protein [Bacillota bacterium]